MLSLEEFVNLCKQICPEWNKYEDWDEGEYWFSFYPDDDYALGMYPYDKNLIYIPHAIGYENGYYVAFTDDGIQPKEWEDQIIINAEDPDAKDRVIKILNKLHQDYKQIQRENKLNKIKEDF